MKKVLLVAAAVAAVFALGSGPAAAATTCSFTTAGTTMKLDGDCTTDSTIVVPNGYTLDGRGRTITAVDPVGGFDGAVIASGGASAYVTNVTVTANNLMNVCKPAGPVDKRLRGILFNGASGSITKTTVIGINKGASGCQEGNAIEVRNAPFDGTHPSTKHVEVAHNNVFSYQKTGIVANGDVNASIHHNKVGSSATQANLAANSIQIGFGGFGLVAFNQVDGNQWCGASNYAASAVLLYLAAAGTTVTQNNVGGNSDVGIWAESDGVRVNNNRVFDDGSIADCNQYGYDFGIGNWGTGNTVTNNKVGGFDYPYDGVTGGNNKTVPGGPAT